MWRLGWNLNFFQFCAQNIDVKCFRASKTFQKAPKTIFLCIDYHFSCLCNLTLQKEIFWKISFLRLEIEWIMWCILRERMSSVTVVSSTKCFKVCRNVFTPQQMLQKYFRNLPVPYHYLWEKFQTHWMRRR